MTTLNRRRSIVGILAAVQLVCATGAAVAADAPVPAAEPAAVPATPAPPATAAASAAAAAPAAATPPAPPVEAATTKTVADNASDPIVCKRDAPLGSRLSGKKECMRRSEWAARAKDSRDSVDRIQRGATAAPPDKNMGGG